MAATITAKALQRAKSRRALLACAVLLALLPFGLTAAFAQLRGHGGPVRALAISSDGATALSGSFDSTGIRWSLTRNAAEQVLRFHADAVNAVALLRDGRAATAGADGKIAIWTPGNAQPDTVLEGHTAPIVALALSPDGATLASASWDQTIRLWPLLTVHPDQLLPLAAQTSPTGVATNSELVTADRRGTSAAMPLPRGGRGELIREHGRGNRHARRHGR